jgi:hypothetical protein
VWCLDTAISRPYRHHIWKRRECKVSRLVRVLKWGRSICRKLIQQHVRKRNHTNVKSCHNKAIWQCFCSQDPIHENALQLADTDRWFPSLRKETTRSWSWKHSQRLRASTLRLAQSFILSVISNCTEQAKRTRKGPPVWKKRRRKKTPWPQSASELYRPSDRRLSAKLVPTFCG